MTYVTYDSKTKTKMNFWPLQFYVLTFGSIGDGMLPVSFQEHVVPVPYPLGYIVLYLLPNFCNLFKSWKHIVENKSHTAIQIQTEGCIQTENQMLAWQAYLYTFLLLTAEKLSLQIYTNFLSNHTNNFVTKWSSSSSR